MEQSLSHKNEETYSTISDTQSLRSGRDEICGLNAEQSTDESQGQREDTSYNIWDEHNQTHSAAGVFCPKEPWPLWKPYMHLSVHSFIILQWMAHTHTHTRGEGFGVHLLLVNDIITGPLQGRLEWPGVPLFRTNRFTQIFGPVNMWNWFWGTFFLTIKKMYRQSNPYMPNTIKSHQ